MQLSHQHRHRGGGRFATTERGRRDGGYILVKFAILIVPLLLMTGFSVDIGFWYNRASDIQKAADAAALAGVVWLPNEDKAAQYAREAAARNGYVDGVDGIDIDVEPVPGNSRRLRVEITDTSVGSFFFLHLGGQEIEISRRATAEYVEPVPLGSPRNYFGTGTLLADPELLYQSVNPSCTSKVNGDRHQSTHYGPLSSGGATLEDCPSAPTNPEYRETGYELYIEAKAARTSAIDVLLYDPRYNDAAIPVAGGSHCWWEWDSNYTDLGRNQRVWGRIQYWDGSRWRELAAGQSQNNVRYVIYGRDVCGDRGIDSKRQSGEQDFTFTLFEADDTPLDDGDNKPVPGCSKTYSANTPFELSYLGSPRWNTLCTITTSMPSGKYILRVTNGAPGDEGDDGSNQWGLVAKYRSAPGNGLCDGRTDPLCPRVYGKDAISVYANTELGVAAFFLSEIAPHHAGKQLEIELWDPGEGGQKIEFLRPNGSNSWTRQRFSWESFNDNGSAHSSGSNVWEVDVTGSKFNGRLLRITVDLTGYNPPVNNQWWKIQYTFGTQVTDRTTWSARVIGDPVHLVEEEAP